MAGPAATALLGDVGGTNARFALYAEGEIGRVEHMKVADYGGPEAAIRAYLARIGPAPAPRRAALAFAGPVEDGRAQLTNGSWAVAAEDLRKRLGLDRVSLVNDLAAVARAVPRLAEAHVVPVGKGRAVGGEPVAVIAPGTGLGVALLIGPGPVVVPTEGGHVTMAPADARESAVLDCLRRRFGHVSAERVVSGQGLENLYLALAVVDGVSAPARRAPQIVERALAGDCPASRAALHGFCAMLGTVAGNLALTLGARGGVYVAGGIVPRMVDWLAGSAFRQRFEDKGRFAPYLRRIPTFVVVHPDPGLLGLAALVDGDICLK